MINLTNLTTSENLFDIVKYVDNQTNHIVGLMLMVSLLTIILFIHLKRGYDVVQSLMASSFYCMVICFMLVGIGLLDDWYLLTFGLVMAFSGLGAFLMHRGR